MDIGGTGFGVRPPCSQAELLPFISPSILELTSPIYFPCHHLPEFVKYRKALEIELQLHIPNNEIQSHF